MASPTKDREPIGSDKEIGSVTGGSNSNFIQKERMEGSLWRKYFAHFCSMKNVNTYYDLTDLCRKAKQPNKGQMEKLYSPTSVSEVLRNEKAVSPNIEDLSTREVLFVTREGKIMGSPKEYSKDRMEENSSSGGSYRSCLSDVVVDGTDVRTTFPPVNWIPCRKKVLPMKRKEDERDRELREMKKWMELGDDEYPYNGPSGIDILRGSDLMKFGLYKEKTYRDVISMYPGYVRWFITLFPFNHTGLRFQYYVYYCRFTDRKPISVDVLESHLQQEAMNKPLLQLPSDERQRDTQISSPEFALKDGRRAGGVAPEGKCNVGNDRIGDGQGEGAIYAEMLYGAHWRRSPHR